MPGFNIAQNELRDPDPVRAADLEAALRDAIEPAPEDLDCSVLLVGFPRDLLRIEFKGVGWVENLPLLPKDVPPDTVGALAGELVERRRTARKPEN